MNALKASITAAALLLTTGAFAADFHGKWCGDYGDSIIIDSKSVMSDEFGADITRVAKSGSVYAISMREDDNDSAGKKLTWHITPSADGQTAKIDGMTYTRCK